MMLRTITSMMLRTITTVKYLLVFLILIGSAWAATINCTSCANCTAEIAGAGVNDTIMLTQHLTTNSSCINLLSKDDFTFDCNGYNITGNKTSGYHGIYCDVNPCGDNVIIRDCPNIGNFSSGIRFRYTNNNVQIINVTARDNFQGFWLWNSINSTVSDCNAYDNRDGFNTLSMENSTLVNINSSYNEEGLDIGGDGNNFSNIVAIDNLYVGFSAWYTDLLYLTDIVIAATSNYGGFDLVPGPDEQIFYSNVTVNGKDIALFDNNNLACPDNQDFSINNTYSFVMFNGCNNVTLRDSDIDDGLYVLYTNSSNFFNITSDFNYYGIHMDDSLNNTFINLSILNSSLFGIWMGNYLVGSKYNHFQDIEVNGAVQALYIDFMEDGNTFRDAKFNYNDNPAIEIWSDNNTILDSEISYNNGTGIEVLQVEGCVFSNLTLFNNTVGFRIYRTANNNTINGSLIAGSTDHGIKLDSFGTDHPSDNLISDNIFNNTVNVFAENESSINFWNTSQQSGTSIIGENNIGGNYWALPNGTGFSETCSDLVSPWGICDNYYNLSNVNLSAVDYLPLAHHIPLNFSLLLYVNDSTMDVGSANVTIKNESDSVMYTALTNSTGHVSTNLPEFSNYTIEIRHVGHVGQIYEHNLTSNVTLSFTLSNQTGTLPNVSTFSENSTDLSMVSDLTDVANLTLVTQDTQIVFNQNVNVSGLDLDTNINTSSGAISIDTANIDNLNVSATLTFFNATCPVDTIYYSSNHTTQLSTVFATGTDCVIAGVCTIVSCIGSELVFNVTHFSSFAMGLTANLSIWDTTDSSTVFENQTMTFYANYTNATNPISGADCQVMDNFTSTWINMSFGGGLYTYNTSFNTSGSYNFTVICNGSSQGYSVLNTTDNFLINVTVDLTAPNITVSYPINDSTLPNTTTWTWVNITTDEIADCSYNLSSPGFDYENSGVAFTFTGSTDHAFNFTGLSENTTYDLYYKCNDSSGNINTNSTYHTFSINATILDTTDAVITLSYPANDTNLSNSTTWTWVNITTNEIADCSYNLTDSGFAYENSGTAFTFTSGTSHSFNYTGLSQNNTYDLYYKCNDTAGNINSQSLHHRFGVNVSIDGVAPIITVDYPPNSTVFSNDTVWTWINLTTDEASDCELGTSAAFSSGTDFDTTGATSHSHNYTISQNNNYTLYYRCNDSSGNSREVMHTFSVNATLDQQAPTISSVSNSSITNISASITWSTDESATTQVKYGTSSGTYSNTENVSGYRTSHSVALSSLTPGTTYYYVTNSTDASGNSEESSEFNFATLSSLAISSVTATSITFTGATITWTTDRAADSDVDYGTTTSMGTSNTNATLVTSHSIALTGLNDDTMYYYTVTSTDADSVLATSSQKTFITLDGSSPIITFTGITNLSTTYNDVADIEVLVTTNEAATCYVDSYKLGSSIVTTNYYLTPANALNRSHSREFDATGVSAGYNFFFTVNCRDADSNAGSSTIYFALNDTTAPTVTFHTATPSNNGAQASTTLYVNLTASESLSSGYPKISVDGATNVSMSSGSGRYTYSKTGLDEDEHNFIVFMLDPYGNKRSYTRVFTVDNTEPEIDYTIPDDNDVFRQCMDIVFNVTLDEEGECDFELFEDEEDDYDECNDDCAEDRTDCRDDADTTAERNECDDDLEECEEDCEDDRYDFMEEDAMEEETSTEDCEEDCEDDYDDCDEICEDIEDTCMAAADDNDDEDDCEEDYDDCEEECQDDQDDCEEDCEDMPFSYLYDFEDECFKDATYLVTFSCEDLAGNEIEENVTFEVNDNVAPVVTTSGPNETITSTSATLRVVTDEHSVCKFSTTDQAYGLMESEFSGSEYTHTYRLTNLENKDYAYYARCNDTRGNAMSTSESISFSVNSTGAPTSSSKSLSEIKTGDVAKFSFDKPGIPITEIAVKVNEDITDAKLDVKTIADTTNLKKPSKPVYEYLQIDKEGISNKQIESVTIDFKVKKDWISQNKAHVEDLRLFKYSTTWDELPTTKISEDSNNVYFEAQTNSFSLFAIMEIKEEQIPVDRTDTAPVTPTDTPDTTTSEPDTTEPETEEPVLIDDAFPWWIILLCVLVVGSGAAGFFVYKSHRHPQQDSFAEPHDQPTHTAAAEEQTTSNDVLSAAAPSMEIADSSDDLGVYISACVDNGQDMEHIRHSLVKKGFTTDDVNYKFVEMGLIDELKDYITTAMQAGMNVDDIKDELTNAGHGPQDVVNKLAEMGLYEKTVTEEEEVHDYIKNSLEDGISHEEITSTLLDAGHERRVIERMMKHYPKQQPHDPQVELHNYVSQARQSGMSDERIRQQLLDSGYEPGQAESLVGSIIEDDETMEYIRNGLAEGVSRRLISAALAKSGHTKKEVNKRYAEIDAAKKKLQNDIHDYTRNCRSDGMSDDEVERHLLGLGFTSKEIKKFLK